LLVMASPLPLSEWLALAMARLLLSPVRWPVHYIRSQSREGPPS